MLGESAGVLGEATPLVRGDSFWRNAVKHLEEAAPVSALRKLCGASWGTVACALDSVQK